MKKILILSIIVCILPSCRSVPVKEQSEIKDQSGLELFSEKKEIVHAEENRQTDLQRKDSEYSSGYTLRVDYDTTVIPDSSTGKYPVKGIIISSVFRDNRNELQLREEYQKVNDNSMTVGNKLIHYSETNESKILKREPPGLISILKYIVFLFLIIMILYIVKRFKR